MNAQAGCLSIVRRVDDVTQAMSKGGGGCLGMFSSHPPPPPSGNPVSAPDMGGPNDYIEYHLLSPST